MSTLPSPPTYKLPQVTIFPDKRMPGRHTLQMRQYALSLTCSDEDVRRWAVQASLRPKQQRPHLTAMYVGHLRQKVARLLKTDERSAKTVQEAMAILGTAQKFERMVTQRFEAEATELRGERVASSPLADPARGTTTLVYSDWWTAARSLNKYAFRLLLCHIIADMSDWLGEGPVNANAEADANANANANTQSPEDPGAKAANIAKQDIESIITSIPYLCTWEEGKSRGASSPCGRNDLVSTQGITSLLVIWPLYLAGDSRFATAEQKEYIQHKLAWMADNRGVRHALGVSKVGVLSSLSFPFPLCFLVFFGGGAGMWERERVCVCVCVFGPHCTAE